VVTPAGCARHSAKVYARGGVTHLLDLTPLVNVRWNRKRDDISDAAITVGVQDCCDELGDLETTIMELHVFRDGVPCWEGPITRLEYRHDNVQIFAEDILWVMKRTAFTSGYSHAYPNIGLVLDQMDEDARQRTYAKYGDPWRMTTPVNRIHKVVSAGGPKTAKTVPAWSITTWEDFDSFAEDAGADYTVVNRDLYFWDINYAWSVLPALNYTHLAEWPYIAEYGNELGTTYIITNGAGFAGVGNAPNSVITKYGHVDLISSSWNESVTSTEPQSAPTPQELAAMLSQAQKQVTLTHPPPVQVVISENSTLMPGAPWDVNTIMPGSWFDFTIDQGLCRRMINEPLRLHHMEVTESATGEVVHISCSQAPSARIDPP
jgi:hypothetical protein